MAERTVPREGRKPLARIVRATDAARLGQRRTFWFDGDSDREWQDAAAAERLVFSEYIRQCIDIGHSMKQAQRNVRRSQA